MNFQIRHRWNGSVLFEYELSAEIVARNYSFRLGFAVKKALETRANLIDADLTDANLTDADLTRARMTRADLEPFKQDMIAEILRLPNEIEALRAAMIEGRIDGSTYSGECACLAGTLAKARGYDHYNGDDIDLGTLTFHAVSFSPRERWFAMIRKGDTPETNQAAKIALGWLDEAIAIRDAIRKSAPCAAS